MSTGGRRFFSGETEAQAVLEAAGSFGLTPAELAYRPVEKKHGFLRRPKVVIEVDPESPRRAAGEVAVASAARPTPPRPEATRAADGHHAGAPSLPAPREPAAVPKMRPSHAPAAHPADASGSWPVEAPAGGLPGALVAAEAVASLAGLRLQARGDVATGEEGDELRIELVGSDRGQLIARQGELLRSCEYLVRRMVRDLPPGGLTLDSGGFREEREQTLRRRAAAAAEEVRRSGEAVRFEPLPAAERRILHLAIQAEPAVRSESEGAGDLRSVCVLPDTGESQGGVSTA